MLTPEELEAGAAAAAATPPVRFQNDPVTPAMARSLKYAALGSPGSGAPSPPGDTVGELAALQAERSNARAREAAQNAARLRALAASLEAGGAGADVLSTRVTALVASLDADGAGAAVLSSP